MAEEPTKQFGWSLHVGSVVGIPIRIHFTFAFLVVWFAYRGAKAGHNPFLAVAFLLLLFGCVVLHELGHALMARRFGVRTRDIVLYPIGGIARLQSIPGGKAELLIALAGPAVNLLLIVLLLPVLAALVASNGAALALELVTPTQLVWWLIIANGGLLVFNLAPAFPMDGGRVLRAALSLRLGPERATEIAAAVGQAMAILFGVIGILGMPFLLIIALLVFIGASQEAHLFRQRSAVKGRAAREAMVTRFEVLAPQDSLQRASQLLLTTHQQDFPVVDAWQRVVGMLSRSRLLHGLAETGVTTAVLDVMERDVPAVHPGAHLDHIVALLRARPHCPIIVLEADRLLGMITLENLTEFIEVARRSGPPRVA